MTRDEAEKTFIRNFKKIWHSEMNYSEIEAAADKELRNYAQSIAERVCEVLAREVEGWQENLKLNIVCYGGNLAMSDVLLRTIKKHVTRPRDWNAELFRAEQSEATGAVILKEEKK